MHWIIHPFITWQPFRCFCNISSLTTNPPWDEICTLERLVVRAGEQTELYSDKHEIALRLSPAGSIKTRVGADQPRRIVARPGDFCLSSQGVPVRGQHARAAVFLCLSLSPAFVTSIAEELELSQHQVEFQSLCCTRDLLIEHLLLALQAEAASGCPSGRLFGEGLATALAVHLLRHYSVRRCRIIERQGGLPPVRLRLVLDYIETHLGAEMSLKTLADLVHLSPHHFANVFRTSVGMSAHQYVLRQRIAKAKELLGQRTMTIADISYALGFASQSHFTTAFGKLAGTTPATYRRGR